MKLLSTFAIAFLMSSDVWAINHILDRMTSPMACAHRGGMTGKSNNTLEQYENAIKDKVDIIELDLRLTKDNVVVVYHDEVVDNAANCKGKKIVDLIWSEIQNCPMSSGHRIPSYESVLSAVNGRVIVDAEFKVKQVIPFAVALVQKYKAWTWAYFQCGDSLEEYETVRRLDPNIALQFKAKTDAGLNSILSWNDRNLIIIEMEKDFVTTARVALAHKYGKFVKANSWKWDAAQELLKAACSKLYRLGIDIAMSNNNKSCVKQRDQI